MDFGRSEVPEELVDPEDSSLLKDTKIPLGFKNEIALELYNVEAEEIKEVVPVVLNSFLNMPREYL